MEVFPGISKNPDVRFGKPCVTGTRVDVATIVEALRAGETFQEIQVSYGVIHEQVLAALRYSSHLHDDAPPTAAAHP